MSTTPHRLLERPTTTSAGVETIRGTRKSPERPPFRDRAPTLCMNAAFIVKTGGPEVVQYGKLPRPTPAPGQVLLKVGAVSVNPIDVEVRSGALPMPLRFPYVIGSDVAGTVTMRGVGVRRFAEGDRVWGTNQGLFGRQGTFSEYVAVDEKWLYPTPAAETDAEAAAGAMVGITASIGLFRTARLQHGEVVFVNGGSGGVGSAVIQQAKAAGARVIATVGSPLKQEFCQNLQADLVLDYRSPSLDDQIRDFVAPFGGIDVWIETQQEPTLERAMEMMAPRGRIVLIGGRTAHPAVPLEEFHARQLALLGVSIGNVLPDVQRECAMALNARYTYGAWRPHVGMTFSLSQAAAAQQLQHTNTFQKRGALVGKIVLIPDR
jgi:NADPH2:quinone reductase